MTAAAAHALSCWSTVERWSSCRRYYTARAQEIGAGNTWLSYAGVPPSPRSTVPLRTVPMRMFPGTALCLALTRRGSRSTSLSFLSRPCARVAPISASNSDAIAVAWLSIIWNLCVHMRDSRGLRTQLGCMYKSRNRVMTCEQKHRKLRIWRSDESSAPAWPQAMGETRISAAPMKRRSMWPPYTGPPPPSPRCRPLPQCRPSKAPRLISGRRVRRSFSGGGSGHLHRHDTPPVCPHNSPLALRPRLLPQEPVAPLCPLRNTGTRHTRLRF